MGVPCFCIHSSQVFCMESLRSGWRARLSSKEWVSVAFCPTKRLGWQADRSRFHENFDDLVPSQGKRGATGSMGFGRRDEGEGFSHKGEVCSL